MSSGSSPTRQVVDLSAGPEWAKWFIGGQLNIAQNCLDRWAGSGRTAILWEGENGAVREIGFDLLFRDVNRLANGLRQAGLVEGDRVAMVMPMVPDIVTILYACFKLGLIVVPIFSGFGEGAIATRLEDSGARIVFTAETLERRGKRLHLGETVRAAARKASAVERVVLDIEELAAGQPDFCETKPMSSEAPCLILVHLGHHRQAEGLRPHACRRTRPNRQRDLAGLRPQGHGPVLLAIRHRLDDGRMDDSRQSSFRRDHPYI